MRFSTSIMTKGTTPKARLKVKWVNAAVMWFFIHLVLQSIVLFIRRNTLAERLLWSGSLRRGKRTFTKVSFIHVAVLVFVTPELSWVNLLQLADLGPPVLLFITLQLCDCGLVHTTQRHPAVLGAGGERLPDCSLPGQDWSGSARSGLDWCCLV